MTMSRLLARIVVFLAGALVAGPATDARQPARYDLLIAGAQ